MKERPILFSAPMVRAILAGQKTQTRRAVKPQPDVVAGESLAARFTPDDQRLGRLGEVINCPYGQPGDRLWVRETWQHSNWPYGPYTPDCTVFFRADYWDDPHGMDGEKSPEGKYRRWNPPIHMPHKASRLQLEVTGIRIERLHCISEADAIAEGIDTKDDAAILGPQAEKIVGPRAGYAVLWEVINGAGSWNDNPWVWVVEFKRVESPKSED